MAIQIPWKIVPLLFNSWLWYRYHILRMPWQQNCCAMYKMLAIGSLQKNPLHLNRHRKIVGKMDPNYPYAKNENDT